MDMIVTETNTYASQVISAIQDPARRQRASEAWTPTTRTEINAYIATVLWSGVVQLAAWDDYWKKDTRQPFMADLFSRMRWQQLTHYIHFGRNDLQGSGDPLYKIRALIDVLNQNFKKHWCLHLVLVLDEGMVPSKSRRNPFRQVVKGKPHPCGIKLFELCDKGNYCFHFEVYTGNKGWDGPHVGLSSDIVYLFLAVVPGRPGEHIWLLDNWYTSISLFRQLNAQVLLVISSSLSPSPSFTSFSYISHPWQGYLIIGAFRNDRPTELWQGLQTKLDNKKLKRGELQWAMAIDAELAAVSWRDAGFVNIVSNFIDPEITLPSQRWRSPKEARAARGQALVAYQLPKCVRFYRDNVHHVDTFNSTVMALRTRHRSRKYYIPLWWSLLKMAVANAWAMQRSNHKKNGLGDTTQKDFIKRLCVQLAADHRQATATPPPAQHWPVLQDRAQVCVSCLLRGSRSNTKFCCEGCDKFIHPRCWAEWHNR